MLRTIAAVAAAALTLLAVTAAFAHAEPVRVKPGADAVLAKAPAIIEILMSQEMARQFGANDIDVFDANGVEITKVTATIDNANRKRLSVALPIETGPGVYTVRWKTLSAEDGDTAQGSYTFTVDPNATANPGREVLREDLLGSVNTPTAAAATGSSTGSSVAPAASVPGGETSGTSWVLVVSVAAIALVIGSGGTFLLVQRKA